ncbi:isochorismatase family protein [Brevundimonas sp. R86498]|uniref:isochorismatase family protein n=1 Tax=Brevundimonas sp. R86498 TaxID=3093845 RepID=UPI0037CB9002
MANINTLNAANCAFVFIDHQPYVAFPVRSIDPTVLIQNVTGLARCGRALGIPTLLTTIGAEGGPLVDPLFQQLAAVYPDLTPVDRHNTNAMSDPAFVTALAAMDRRRIVVSGLWTEVCLAQTVISMLAHGYEVFFVADCSGGLSLEAHEEAKRRMTQAGAIPMTWLAVVSEIAPDFTTPEFQSLLAPTADHGQALAFNVQYSMAQYARLQAGA